MKIHNFLILLVIFFMRTGIINAQQWRFYNPTLTYDINAVAISKPGNITVGGGSELNVQQVIFNTPDYGYAWNGNTGDGLFPWNKSLVFADTITGYGVGDRGRIIKTIDGGQDWLFSAAPIDRSLNKIVCVNAQTYFVAGGHKDSLQTILKSTDGGQTWNVIYDQPGPWLKAIYFIDTLKGFAVGDSGTIIGTTNGGSTWNPVSSPLVRDFTGVAFTTASAGFITGGTANDSLRTILQTTNGGNTWTVLKDETGGKLNDIWFIDANTGYVTGDSATLLRTLNGGLNWAAQSIPGTTGNEVFNAVRFYNPTFGVVAGKAGRLYVYANLAVGELTQVQAIHNDSASRVFQATINTHGTPSHLYFMLATDTGFTQNLQYSYQINITNDSAMVYDAYVGSIHPNTLYYYKAILGSAASVLTSNIYTFYNGISPYLFAGKLATNVTSNSAQLNALVNKMPVPLQLKFNYGTTASLGSQVIANPVSLSDSGLVNISASLTGLQPNTVYYYVLQGDGIVSFTSDTIAFYTGSATPVVQTLESNYFTDTTAMLNGIIGGFRVPVKPVFFYGTTASLGAQAFGLLYSINDTDLHAVMEMVNLQPNTQYYYCLAGIAFGDTIYGDTLQLYTGNLFAQFATLQATNVTNSTAQLNGVVDGLTFASNLSFEYGLTPALGSELGATPASVSDALMHNVSLALSGLQTGNFYYYRLKATTATGLVYHGQTLQLFAGANEIPNWDFEYWQNTIAVLPQTWNTFQGAVEQAAGNTGIYAVKLRGNASLVNCLINGDGGSSFQFSAGQPFHYRPDSLIFYLQSDIAAGDTGGIFLALYSGNTVIANTLYNLTGNTGGIFKRIALPVNYSSSGIPDTLVLAFSPSKSGLGNPADYMVVDDISFGAGAPAVTNGDFETWYSDAFFDLQTWITSNIVSTDLYKGNQPCITQTYFNAPNDHAATIQNYTWNGQLIGAEIFLRPDFLHDAPYFPVLGRHDNLNGYFKFDPVNGDTAFISVNMYKQGRIVGGGGLGESNTVSNFTPFQFHIVYIDSTVIPDSASIHISSFLGQVKGTSALTVDKLRFDNAIVLSTKVLPSASEISMNIYPNPAQNRVMVEMSKPSADDGLLRLMTLSGQVIGEKRIPASLSIVEFDLSNVPSGFYMLNMSAGKLALNTKLVVIK